MSKRQKTEHYTANFPTSFEDTQLPIRSNNILTVDYDDVDFEKLIEDSHRLNCSGKTISIHSFKDFFNTHFDITHLNLSNCSLSYIKFNKLIDGWGGIISSLVSLDLSSNPLHPESFMRLTRYLATNPEDTKNLVDLNFSNCAIIDGGYLYFMQNLGLTLPNLTTLDFSHNKISDMIRYTLQIVPEKVISRLKVLDLTDNKCDTGGISNLQKLILYNGYECKLSKKMSDEEFSEIAKTVFNYLTTNSGLSEPGNMGALALAGQDQNNINSALSQSENIESLNLSGVDQNYMDCGN